MSLNVNNYNLSLSNFKDMVRMTDSGGFATSIEKTSGNIFADKTGNVHNANSALTRAKGDAAKNRSLRWQLYFALKNDNASRPFLDKVSESLGLESKDGEDQKPLSRRLVKTLLSAFVSGEFQEGDEVLATRNDWVPESEESEENEGWVVVNVPKEKGVVKERDVEREQDVEGEQDVEKERFLDFTNVQALKEAEEDALNTSTFQMFTNYSETLKAFCIQFTSFVDGLKDQQISKNDISRILKKNIEEKTPFGDYLSTSINDKDRKAILQTSVNQLAVQIGNRNPSICLLLESILECLRSNGRFPEEANDPAN